MFRVAHLLVCYLLTVRTVAQTAPITGVNLSLGLDSLVVSKGRLLWKCAQCPWRALAHVFYIFYCVLAAETSLREHLFEIEIKENASEFTENDKVSIQACDNKLALHCILQSSSPPLGGHCSDELLLYEDSLPLKKIKSFSL